MDEGVLDISKIPRFQFEIHNEELTNCIKELYFQLKTTDKRAEKLKREVELKLNEATLSDLLQEITSSIDIHPALLKELPPRSEAKLEESQLKNSCSRFGARMGQVGEVMRVLSEKFRQLERRMEQSEAQLRQQVGEKTQALQSQLEESKKAQSKENRSLSESILLTHNRYEEKLKEVESNTLWQINDCKMQLSQRVNEQYVKDATKEAEVRLMNRLKEAVAKTSIDPALIDHLQSKATKLEKELEVKVVEIAARINEIRDTMDINLPSRKDFNEEKLQNEKKIGNLQLALAQANRKIKNLEQDTKDTQAEVKAVGAKGEASAGEIGKVGKMVANLRMSDDFMRLMEKLDPHKICEMDASISTLEERQLKLEREVDTLKRYIQKFREKVEICNLLAPSQQGGKTDKEEVGKMVSDAIASNPSIKRIPTLEAQLYELRVHSDLIAEINKRISKMQKEFDIQGVLYGLRGLEEYIKKELLVLTTKLTHLEGQLNDDRRRRPLSAKRPQDTKISSSVSFKKLVPVDCISCFQNPLGERTPERGSFGKRG